MEFASVFKKMCKEKGVTQKTALEEMGMGRNAPQRWTDGGLPSYESMVKIADYFDVSLDSLTKSSNAHEITASGRSTVALNNSGAVATNGSSISQGPADQLTDMEVELLRIFRGLDMRKKNALMSAAYDMEDTMRKE